MTSHGLFFFCNFTKVIVQILFKMANVGTTLLKGCLQIHSVLYNVHTEMAIIDIKTDVRKTLALFEILTKRY